MSNVAHSTEIPADFNSSANALSRFAFRPLRMTDAPASPGGLHVSLTYSRREIAEMIGVSTETAVRLLGRLRDRGVLSLAHRELTVHDAERLRRIARHCDIEV